MVAKNISEFGRNPPKYGAFQYRVAKFRRSFTFRSVPWLSVLFLCVVGSFVSHRLPQLGVGDGVSGAENIRELGRNPPEYGGYHGGV